MRLSTERGSPLLIAIAVLVVGSILGAWAFFLAVELAPFFSESERVQLAIDMSVVLGLLPVGFAPLMTYLTATLAALFAFFGFVGIIIDSTSSEPRTADHLMEKQDNGGGDG